MEDEVFQILKWILSTIGSVTIFIFLLWVKFEKKNEDAHNKLHARINEAAKESTRQHGELKDHILDLWKHKGNTK